MCKFFQCRNGFLFFTFLFFFFTAGCSEQKIPGKQKVLAYVNNEPIYESDLKRCLDIKAHIDPNFQPCPESIKEELNTIIDKKLLIQAAIEKGLVRQEKFVNTIKTFWEQTLIRDFIIYKKQQDAQSLSVTEDEIKKYYDNLHSRVIFKILKSPDEAKIRTLHEQIKTNIEIGLKNFKTIGPVNYEDITADVLKKSFDLPVGAPAIVKEGQEFYIVMVISRDSAEVQPLEQLRPQIEKSIMANKEKMLLDDWLRKQREKAKINILGQ